MTKTTSKYVEKMAGPARTGAYLIMKEGTHKIQGKILIAYGKDGAGTLYVNVWDWSNDQHTPDVQTGKDGYGGGYDKVGAALEGLKFSGVTLKDSNWQEQLTNAGFIVQWVI